MKAFSKTYSVIRINAMINKASLTVEVGQLGGVHNIIIILPNTAVNWV